MPRRPRVRLDGLPLHIAQRGHNREPCFFAEEDYQSYRHWFGEALVKCQCNLHAYVLMTNHTVYFGSANRLADRDVIADAKSHCILPKHHAILV